MESSSSDNSWRDDADCQGLELNLFFEQYESDPDTAVWIDEVCAGCPVQEQCLKMGLKTSGTGLHGGAYLNLGQFTKPKNAHKTDEQMEDLRDQITDLREEIKNES